MPVTRTEIPAGLINGVNITFTTSVPYLAGTVFPIVNGLMRRPSDADGIIEVSPAGGTFTTRQTLATGQTLEVQYNDTSQNLSDVTGYLSQQAPVSVVAGEANTFPFTVTNSSGAPLNITGWTIYFSVKKFSTDEDYLIYKASTTPAQITILDALNGRGEIYTTSADTIALCPTVFAAPYFYDLWALMSNSTYKTIIKAVSFRVTPGIFIVP